MDAYMAYEGTTKWRIKGRRNDVLWDVLSAVDVAISRPLGLQATASTGRPCLTTRSTWPVDASVIRKHKSLDSLATYI